MTKEKNDFLSFFFSLEAGGFGGDIYLKHKGRDAASPERTPQNKGYSERPIGDEICLSDNSCHVLEQVAMQRDHVRLKQTSICCTVVEAAVSTLV